MKFWVGKLLSIHILKQVETLDSKEKLKIKMSVLIGGKKMKIGKYLIRSSPHRIARYGNKKIQSPVIWVSNKY